MYAGDTSKKARKIVAMYVGDANNIARKISCGYVGDINNIARLFYHPEDYGIGVTYYGTEFLSSGYSIKTIEGVGPEVPGVYYTGNTPTNVRAMDDVVHFDIAFLGTKAGDKITYTREFTRSVGGFYIHSEIISGGAIVSNSYEALNASKTAKTVTFTSTGAKSFIRFSCGQATKTTVQYMITKLLVNDKLIFDVSSQLRPQLSITWPTCCYTTLSFDGLYVKYNGAYNEIGDPSNPFYIARDTVFNMEWENLNHGCSGSEPGNIYIYKYASGSSGSKSMVFHEYVSYTASTSVTLTAGYYYDIVFHSGCGSCGKNAPSTLKITAEYA